IRRHIGVAELFGDVAAVDGDEEPSGAHRDPATGPAHPLEAGGGISDPAAEAGRRHAAVHAPASEVLAPPQTRPRRPVPRPADDASELRSIWPPPSPRLPSIPTTPSRIRRSPQPFTQTPCRSSWTTSTRSDCASITLSIGLYAIGVSSITPSSLRHSMPAVAFT